MQHESVPIIRKEELVNDFYQITLAAPHLQAQAQPGHSVILNQHSSHYVASTNKGLDFIIAPPFSLALAKMESCSISALQDLPLAPPDTNNFMCLLVQASALSVCLFYLKKYRAQFRGFIIIGATELGFPFLPCPSSELIESMPPNIIAALPLLEDWGVSHRLCSPHEIPGVFHGSIESLYQVWRANSHHPLVHKTILLE